MLIAASSLITLIADPKVLAIPIHPSDEALVDIGKEGFLCYGPSPEIKNNQDYTFMRKTVYEKIKEAQVLLPKGLRFCLYEGYRSLNLQKRLFETQYANVKKQHPHWTSTQLFNETTKLVSPAINQDGSANIPPHSTGGAVDLYLIDDRGKAVDMGIHPKDWMQDLGGQLSLTDSKRISALAREHRQLMSHALKEVGFVNYPTEYWHWSYGDKYWAYIQHQPYALYAIASPT